MVRNNQVVTKRIVLLVCLPLLLLRCIGKSPSNSEIVGTWRSDVDAVLEFKEHGVFTGQSLPAKYFTVWSWKEENEILKLRVNGSGKWMIVEGQGGWEIQLSFEQESDKRMLGKLNVLLDRDGQFGMGNGWIIWLWEGDEGDNIEFHKK